MIQKEQIEKIILEKIGETDFFVVDIAVKTGNHVAVEIDSPKGITISECLSFSRAIEGSFDREVEDFSLEVASPGLDKPLRVTQQYHKNIGRSLKVKTINGEEYKGELIQVDDAGIVLTFSEKKKIEGKKKKEVVVTEQSIAYTDIKTAVVIISFK